MQDQTQQRGASIVLPLDTMVRTKSVMGGTSFNCGDAVAKALDRVSLPLVRKLAVDAFGIEVDKYNHLNPGQQRMTIGNVLRNKLRRDTSLVDMFEQHAAVVRELADIENASMSEESEQAKAEKEAKRLAKEQAKADEKAAKEAQKAADRAAKATEKAQKAAEKASNPDAGQEVTEQY